MPWAWVSLVVGGHVLSLSAVAYVDHLAINALGERISNPFSGRLCLTHSLTHRCLSVSVLLAICSTVIGDPLRWWLLFIETQSTFLKKNHFGFQFFINKRLSASTWVTAHCRCPCSNMFLCSLLVAVAVHLQCFIVLLMVTACPNEEIAAISYQAGNGNRNHNICSLKLGGSWN